jgi:hypothetical protein
LDAQKFAELYRPIFEEGRKIRFGRTRYTLYIYLYYVKCLFESGELESAIMVLEELITHI